MVGFLASSRDTNRAGPQADGRSEGVQRNVKVLVIDDDVGTVDTFAIVLRDAGFEVETAVSAKTGVAAARQRRFDCFVIDLRLGGDVSGIDVLRELRGEHESASFIIISAWLSTAAIVQATKLGAFDVIEKPVDSDDLIASISASIAESHRADAPPSPGAVDGRHRSVAERFSMYVAKACRADGDPSTLDLWAKEAAVSYSTLCEICRLNGLRPLDARDFMRVLRALRKATAARCTPEAFLAVSDRRTLRSLSTRAGVDLEAPATADVISEFLKSQRLIPNTGEPFHTIAEFVYRW